MGKTRQLQYVRKLLKSLRRQPRKIKSLWLLLIVVFFFGCVWIFGDSSMTKVHPSAYRPLLDTIAQGESNGNYNAYYSNSANNVVRFTEMSISDVLDWQEDYAKQGHPSTAVGRYQIIRPTLQGLVRQLKLDTSAPFDPALQDKLAIALMERRGSIALVDNKINKETFAHELSKEWAALPIMKGDKPTRSYYDGDGLNKSRTSPKDILTAIDAFEIKAQMSQR